MLEASEGECIVRGNIAPLIELGAGFDLELTARENIYLNGALLGYTEEFIDAHFQEIVEFAELPDFVDMPMKNFSSGMVARIAFAIATITEPDILIVDETLSVGDVFFQEKCERRIQHFIDDGHVTVLPCERRHGPGRAHLPARGLDREGRPAHGRPRRRSLQGISRAVRITARESERESSPLHPKP